MTDATDNTQLKDAQILELEIDQNYKDQAFETIKSLVKGNKYNPDDVKLEAFEGKVLRFSAYTLSTLVTKRTKTLKPGRIEKAKQVSSEEEANVQMDAAYKALGGQEDLERNVRDSILGRKDKGFSIEINNTFIPLPALRKDFVIFDACHTCKAKGTVSCLPCNGNGRVNCTRCNGTGRQPCTHCKGMRQVPMAGQPNKKVQCPVCNGQGFSGCALCNSTRFIPCKVCASKGYTQCPNCQGTAWNSNIFTQEIEAKMNFHYPREKLPEKVAVSMEERSSKISEHAIIRIITDNVNIEQWKELQANSVEPTPFNEALKLGDICFPVLYDATLPYGHIEYTINDKSYYTFLFGQKAVLDHVSPFLDDLVAEGIRKLKDAAELRGDVSSNLKAAGEYRTVQEGIVFTATSPLKKAKLKLKRANPLGLSDNAIIDIVRSADRAMKNITQKPRVIGATVAGVGYFALFSGYFLSPLRDMIVGNIPNSALHALADVSVLGASVYIGMTAIQANAGAVLKKTMKRILPHNVKSAPPKLGKIVYWNIGAACLAFLATVEASRHVSSATIPSWYESLLGAIM